MQIHHCTGNRLGIVESRSKQSMYFCLDHRANMLFVCNGSGLTALLFDLVGRISSTGSRPIWVSVSYLWVILALRAGYLTVCSPQWCLPWTLASSLSLVLSRQASLQTWSDSLSTVQLFPRSGLSSSPLPCWTYTVSRNLRSLAARYVSMADITSVEQFRVLTLAISGGNHAIAWSSEMGNGVSCNHAQCSGCQPPMVVRHSTHGHIAPISLTYN